MPSTAIDCGRSSILRETTPSRSNTRPLLLRVLSRGSANVFDDHEEMARISRQRNEPEMVIECRRPIILGVNRERAYADHVGHLQRSFQRIEQQSSADAAALR
jgi:hypothetical protein